MGTISATDFLTPSASKPSLSTAKANGMAALGSQDFLKLMLTELTNQDPLKPTDNEALLRQISSIRDIELSTSMSDSIRQLTGQQQIGASSALVGQFVTGAPGEDGSVTSGLVVGVRFADGHPKLLLSNGAELPVEQIASVEPAQQAAERLVGSTVLGMDRRNASKPELVQGMVSGVSQTSNGEVFVELDSGANLRLRDVISVLSGDGEQ